MMIKRKERIARTISIMVGTIDRMLAVISRIGGKRAPYRELVS